MSVEDSNVWTTSQVSAHLGVTDDVVRKAKSRNKDCLQEGLHWLNDNGRTLWTSAGMGELANLLIPDAASGHTIGTDTDLGHATGTPATDGGHTTETDNPITAIAGEIARNIVENQLPSAIRFEIRRIFTAPSYEEQQMLSRVLLEFRVGADLIPSFTSGFKAGLVEQVNPLQLLEGTTDAAN